MTLTAVPNCATAQACNEYRNSIYWEHITAYVLGRAIEEDRPISGFSLVALQYMLKHWLYFVWLGNNKASEFSTTVAAPINTCPSVPATSLKYFVN